MNINIHVYEINSIVIFEHLLNSMVFMLFIYVLARIL